MRWGALHILCFNPAGTMSQRNVSLIIVCEHTTDTLSLAGGNTDSSGKRFFDYSDGHTTHAEA